MANLIQIKRGLKTSLPNLEVGEFGLATDTNEVFIGTPTGNKLVNSSGGGGGLTPEQEAKLNLIKDNGVGDKYLADDGTYKVVSGGDGIDLDTLGYMNYAADIFYRGGHQSLFSNAWTNHNKRTTLFEGNISLELEDEGIAIYSGDGVDELYDLIVSGGIRHQEALKITIDDTVYDATSIDSVTDTGEALRYTKFTLLGLPGVVNETGGTFLMVVDGADIEMPLGKVIVIMSEEIANYLKIESGFNHYYENGIIIPEGVEIVPIYSYSGYVGVSDVTTDYFRNNNFPLVIPNSVTNIGERAFSDWYKNNQPLIIPNSVTEIGRYAFEDWEANTHPLVIPDSVTSIGVSAFSGWRKVPYVEMRAITPPTLASSDVFWGQGGAPIYVPDESVEAYKTATTWSNTLIADRIFPISDK